MLRLYDAGTGRTAEVPRGVLRVRVVGAGPRTVVTADLLRRVAGRRGGRVVRVTAPAGERDWAEYNVPPAEPPDGPADIYVSPVLVPGHCLVVPGEHDDTGLDPAHARMAILSTRYRDDLTLTAGAVAGAGERLTGWRARVAEWARAPGRPMDREYAAAALDALDDDLDGPAAIAVLDRLAADPAVPPGAKLETFIHVDLLLGLNVVSDIGR